MYSSNFSAQKEDINSPRPLARYLRQRSAQKNKNAFIYAFFFQGLIIALKVNFETFQMVLPGLASVNSSNEFSYRYFDLWSRK